MGLFGSAKPDKDVVWGRDIVTIGTAVSQLSNVSSVQELKLKMHAARTLAKAVLCLPTFLDRVSARFALQRSERQVLCALAFELVLDSERELAAMTPCT